MKFVEISPNEERIVLELRSLKAHEKMEVIADQNGRPGVFLVNRISRAILIEGVVQMVKFKND